MAFTIIMPWCHPPSLIGNRWSPFLWELCTISVLQKSYFLGVLLSWDFKGIFGPMEILVIIITCKCLSTVIRHSYWESLSFHKNICATKFWNILSTSCILVAKEWKWSEDTCLTDEKLTIHIWHLTFHILYSTFSPSIFPVLLVGTLEGSGTDWLMKIGRFTAIGTRECAMERLFLLFYCKGGLRGLSKSWCKYSPN